MSSPVSRLRLLSRLGETLLIALLGGWLAATAGLPAGWLSGSMLLVALAAICGRPLTVPMPVARIFFVLVGILLGSVVTPETVKGIAAWPLSIAVLALSAVCMIVGTTSYLRWVHRWDPLSALLGASPGSMAQVMMLSAEYGADLRAIAVVQTIRVLLLTVGIPLGLALFGLAGSSTTFMPTGTASAPPLELAILVVVAALAGAVMVRLRLPGGLLFGAMIGSAVLHGTGLIHAGLPGWVAIAAVVGAGAVAGARFANTTVRMLLSYIGAALGSFAVAITIASGFVLLVTSLLSLRVADVVIAFSPGAQDTMMVLALALALDPVFVGTHHLVRFVIVSLTIPVLAQRALRAEGAKLKAEPKRRPAPGIDH
jgi:membrane AbrB-like protein